MLNVDKALLIFLLLVIVQFYTSTIKWYSSTVFLMIIYIII